MLDADAAKTVEELLLFMERHDYVAEFKALRQEVERQQELHSEIPVGMLAPLARSVRNALRTDGGLIALAWREFDAVSSPVFDRWQDDGVEPPKSTAMAWQPPVGANEMERCFEAARQELAEDDGTRRAKLFVGMSALGILHAMLNKPMRNSLPGYTRGSTQDVEIGARKARFLGLTWAPECKIDFEILRNAWAHGAYEVGKDTVIIYADKFDKELGRLELSNILYYIRAALAAYEAFWASWAIASIIVGYGDSSPAEGA